jgi:hypothetical protein
MEEFEKEQLLLKKKAGLAFCQLSFLIMPFALGNLNGVFFYTVYQPVFVINPPAEPALQIMFKWLGLAYAIQYTIALNAFYQSVYPFYSLLVFQLPVKIFLPRTTRPLFTHQ